MSRIARKPIMIPEKVTVSCDKVFLHASGAKGKLSYAVHQGIDLKVEDNKIYVTYNAPQDSTLSDLRKNKAVLGTAFILIKNILMGVSLGFEKSLRLVGVGYKANVRGNVLELALGFSHPIVYNIPAGVSIETPSNTDIVVRSIDKRLLGQVAADIRAFRSPEIYKGKGVRYADEVVPIKEIKKK